MDVRFDNKVALVTGAAGGIGLAVSKMFAEAGAKVAMADIDEEKIMESAMSLKEQGLEVMPLVLDVAVGQTWAMDGGYTVV